jgi:sugar transferase (PEP-CTERM/EpsH1 system associated)
MSRFALESPLFAYPLVMDLVDVDSEKWAALATTAPWSKRWVYKREARCLAEFERQAAAHARATLVVTDHERAAFRAIAPEADVHVIPNGVDVASFRPAAAPTEQPKVVFCGVMNYEPNVEAARWFSEQVWPRVIAQRPDARLSIVGSRPTNTVVSLARRDPTIDVTGHVPQVQPYLWDAAIAVAPLLTARGVQNKVLEAVAAGLPTVVTPTVDSGLPWQVRPSCRVAESAESFATEVVNLLRRSASERRAIAAQASINDLTWERQLLPLEGILARAAAPEPAVLYA